MAAFIGLLVFWENHRESFEAIGASLERKKTPPTKRGCGIQLSLTNEREPADRIIEDATLAVPSAEGEVKILFYISDPRVFNRYAIDPGMVESDERETLPIAIEPNTARTVVMLADPDTLNDGEREEAAIRKRSGGLFANSSGTAPRRSRR